MTANIRLMVNSGSGVLAQVAHRLQASGVRVKSHSFDTMSDTSSLLTLETEPSGEVDVADLTARLSELDVVQRVEDMRFHNGAPVRKEPKVEVQQDLVNRIVSAYPKIMPHIQDYEEQIAGDPNRNDKLLQLGVAVGAKFAKDADTGGLDSKAEIIDNLILPRISSIAEASRDDDSVVVSISLFTRRMVTSMDLFSGDVENCYFMCGLIEGLTTAVPGNESTSVRETKCRANGDSACIFLLN